MHAGRGAERKGLLVEKVLVEKVRLGFAPGRIRVEMRADEGKGLHVAGVLTRPPHCCTLSGGGAALHSFAVLFM